MTKTKIKDFEACGHEVTPCVIEERNRRHRVIDHFKITRLTRKKAAEFFEEQQVCDWAYHSDWDYQILLDNITSGWKISGNLEFGIFIVSQTETFACRHALVTFSGFTLGQFADDAFRDDFPENYCDGLRMNLNAVVLGVLSVPTDERVIDAKDRLLGILEDFLSNLEACCRRTRKIFPKSK